MKRIIWWSANPGESVLPMTRKAKMTTQRELEEMEQDLINLEIDRVKEICRDVMRDELFEAEVAKQELKLLRTGEAVLIPADVEHARSMFKMASFYLTQYDPTFTLRHEAV